MFRIIHMINSDQEKIFLTNDLEADASDFCESGFLVENDNQYNGSIPLTFPIESTFVKE